MMEFSEACCEVDYILEHLHPEDKKKIPKSVVTFFKENKAIFYKVDLNPTKPLVEQNLKDETKAFLQILSYKYFANENQKQQLKETLEEDSDIQNLISEKVSSEEITNNTTVELTVYKENKIRTFFKNIIRFFKRKTD